MCLLSFAKERKIMEMITKNKKISLVYRTSKIVKITNLLDGKSFEEVYFKALTEKNLESLSKIIFIFAEDADTGISAFQIFEEVYDFIDVYMEEKNKTYNDIFKEIAEDINKMGFFNKKMTKEELMEKINSDITIDMNEIIKKSAEKAVANIAEEEFKFSRG